MSKHFKIIIIKFFGLREPDVEWFRIEEVQKD